jgi:hypothetical protein
MKPKCYFCDTELDVVLHTFRVGPKDEPVCEECYLKTIKTGEGAQADAQARFSSPIRVDTSVNFSSSSPFR